MCSVPLAVVAGLLLVYVLPFYLKNRGNSELLSSGKTIDAPSL